MNTQNKIHLAKQAAKQVTKQPAQQPAKQAHTITIMNDVIVIDGGLLPLFLHPQN